MREETNQPQGETFRSICVCLWKGSWEQAACASREICGIGSVTGHNRSCSRFLNTAGLLGLLFVLHSCDPAVNKCCCVSICFTRAMQWQTNSASVSLLLLVAELRIRVRWRKIPGEVWKEAQTLACSAAVQGIGCSGVRAHGAWLMSLGLLLILPSKPLA